MPKGKATDDDVGSGEIKEPDFERAIKIINHDIDPADEKNAKARGDMGASWKKIEDECHCNRKAAKDFRKIRNMTDELRDDYLRTLYGLMQVDGIGISQDLVDRADGAEAPTMPVVERKAPELATLQ